MVGPRWSAGSHELRDLLSHNRIRHPIYDQNSADGRRLLAQVGVDPGGQPVVLMPGGQVLADPPPRSCSPALGIPTQPAGGCYDLAVVGTTSLIRNYLGFPRGISGQDLAQRAAEQAIMFGAELVAQPAAGLAARPGGGRVLTLADGSQAICRAVVLATGVSYRRLPVPGLDELVGAGVFYGASVTEAQAMVGSR